MLKGVAKSVLGKSLAKTSQFSFARYEAVLLKLLLMPSGKILAKLKPSTLLVSILVQPTPALLSWKAQPQRSLKTQKV